MEKTHDLVESFFDDPVLGKFLLQVGSFVMEEARGIFESPFGDCCLGKFLLQIRMLIVL